MAKFRKVHTTFWSDPFVQELTPEQKFFYLYLLTNDKATQCGIYELPVRQASFDTGYTMDTVSKLLEFFVDNNKIVYSKESREVLLINWYRYNYSESPKVITCIESELELVKDRSLVEYLYSMDTLGILKHNKKEKENKKENENNALPFATEAFASAWGGWVRHRHEIRKKLTPSSIARQHAFLAKYDEATAIAILNQSIEKGWQGLFDLTLSPRQLALPVNQSVSHWDGRPAEW